MCYITLSLTLEYAVVPQLQRENRGWTAKQIARKKYTYFYQLLCNKPECDIDSVGSGARSKFAVNISFGKIYWSLLQELGITALLILAVGDIGLTVIARAMGPESYSRSCLVMSLSHSREWWSFGHAIGPTTLRKFFGPCNIQYMVQQLLQELRTEPLPTASILLINQSCLEEIVITNELAKEEVPSPKLGT